MIITLSIINFCFALSYCVDVQPSFISSHCWSLWFQVFFQAFSDVYKQHMALVSFVIPFNALSIWKLTPPTLRVTVCVILFFQSLCLWFTLLFTFLYPFPCCLFIFLNLVKLLYTSFSHLVVWHFCFAVPLKFTFCRRKSPCCTWYGNCIVTYICFTSVTCRRKEKKFSQENPYHTHHHMWLFIWTKIKSSHCSIPLVTFQFMKMPMWLVVTKWLVHG